MINGVWIIHKDGKCLFFREYTDLNINEQLFSGFLVALMSFSKEISHQEIKSINLEELTLFYKNVEEKKLIFVIATDSSVREQRTREIIDLIEEAFITEFGDILKDWKGDIRIFQKFETKLDEILSKKGKEIRLFDISFISKNSIENMMKKISHLFGVKEKKEIEELDHTLGVMEHLNDEIERFNPPKFLIDVPQKLKKVFNRLFHTEK